MDLRHAILPRASASTNWGNGMLRSRAGVHPKSVYRLGLPSDGAEFASIAQCFDHGPAFGHSI